MSCDSKAMWSWRAFNFALILAGLVQRSAATVCNGRFNIDKNFIYNITSRNYPNYYPAYSQSICKFTAPRDYTIQAICYVDTDKGPNGCSTEAFYISQEGDTKFRDAEKLCGSGSVVRKSLFRSIAFGHTSSGSFGRYMCTLQAKPQPSDCGWSINTKISNGVDAAVNEFPSLVLLKFKSNINDLYCGGSIISYRYILTAAHCAQRHSDPSEIEIQVGRYNITSNTDTKYAASYNIIDIIIHPDYDRSIDRNDIALMVTASDIEYSRGVGPICLPFVTNINNNFEYDYVNVAGWGVREFGKTSSPILQKTTLLITTNDACNSVYQNIDSTQICTYDYAGDRRDTCQLDSGGPVIYSSGGRQFLIGIISYGTSCGVKPYAVAVNTRVTAYLNWIHENIQI